MRSAPRVLFLARHLDSGGVTTHMMTLGRALAQRGWDVALASAGLYGVHEHGPEWFAANGIAHYTVPFSGPAPAPALLWRSARSMAALDGVVRAFRPSVIHVHWRSTSPFAAVESSLRSVPFVSTLHLDGIPAGGLLRTGSRWGQRVIAISSETRDYLATSFGVPEDRLRVVHNGVDDARFYPAGATTKQGAKAGLGLDSERPVACLLGRLEKVKGHAVLLAAAAQMNGDIPGLQLLFAGEGSERQALETMAASLGLSERTCFAGYADSRAVLWASDLFVLPSYQEGFPVAVVESMLCGVPVIRTPAAGAADQVVDGVTGFIVPFGDSQQLARRMTEVLSDSALAARMAQAARAKAQAEFSLDRMVESVEGIYVEAGARSA